MDESKDINFKGVIVIDDLDTGGEILWEFKEQIDTSQFKHINLIPFKLKLKENIAKNKFHYFRIIIWIFGIIFTLTAFLRCFFK